MLIFRTDESNFADGERDGTRIVIDTGLKVDFDEFAPDADSLGLWHLHDGACQGEGTGLEEASGGGNDFTNYGADVVEDGYEFVRDDGDYLQADFPGQPERSRLTLEAWVRAWSVPDGVSGWVARYYRDGQNHLNIEVRQQANHALATITANLKVGGSTVGSATWTGAGDLLAGDAPWHVAAVVDSPGSLRLFVGGVLRAEDTSDLLPLPVGDYGLLIGALTTGGGFASCVVDEVYLSAAPRYAADFTPHRLLASGTYASVTFDAVRTAADWLDLLAEQNVPPGCDLAWEVRAAEELDGFGRPQALWQPFNGDPQTLPDGRYLQWRATPAASADRLTSPTLESAEVHAGEAGYNLYRGTGAGPETLDYTTPSDCVGPGVTQLGTGSLAPGTGR